MRDEWAKLTIEVLSRLPQRVNNLELGAFLGNIACAYNLSATDLMQIATIADGVSRTLAEHVAGVQAAQEADALLKDIVSKHNKA